MTNTNELWLMNTHHSEVTIPMLDVNPPRIQKFKPNRPIPFPRSIGLKYMNRFNTIKVVEDPSKYFRETGFEHLIIRDQGIGDLLLMEPTIRALGGNNRNVTLMSVFPEIYKYHPGVRGTIKMRDKYHTPHDPNDYEVITDLRNASERHDRRAEWHRTDIFNSVVGVETMEKEPRLYWELSEPTFKKQSGFKYVGVQFDASENYRRYPEPLARDIINYIVQNDQNTKVVIFGHRPYIRFNNPNVIDLQVKTNIEECINNLAAMDYFISCDSGLLHFALAMHIPTVAWFSKINPDLRLRYYTGAKRLVLKKMVCRPCGDHNDSGCMHGDASQDPDYRVPKFMAPCAQIEAKTFYDNLISLPPSQGPMIYAKDGTKVEVGIKEQVGIGV